MEKVNINRKIFQLLIIIQLIQSFNSIVQLIKVFQLINLQYLPPLRDGSQDKKNSLLIWVYTYFTHH